MKNLKLLAITFVVSLLVSVNAFSQTIGSVNYKNILINYNYAKETIKMLDSKETELQQYMLDKERQFKAMTSPVERKNFEDKVQKEYKAKVDNLSKLKIQKEEEIYKNILAEVKKVSTQKKIDVIFDSSVIMTGGTDITAEVISGLNK